ncbi:MAG: hypothetical protein R3B82_01570 [Sandaracinaceae bacterium]
MNRLLRGLLAFALATLVWVPAVHFGFTGDADREGRARVRASLMETQLAMVEDPALRDAALERMRATNAEWDFMGRTFVVLALANHALDRPDERDRALRAVDFLIEETLRLEAERGQDHFLMDYVHAGRFRDPSERSVFVDGEIALMLAARQRVEPAERWRAPLAERIAVITGQMERGPMLSAESYPDECWTFCNTVALAAIRVSDAVTGQDHDALLSGWVEQARAHLIDSETGLLVSSYRWDGTHLDGPEGSSIFMAAHMLELVDPDFARDQYDRAREQLGVSFAGFGWAREWPASWEGPADVDSGPVVPLVDASAGASGMALLGAAAFGDEVWLEELHTSLAFAAFPTRDDAGRLRFAASNQVGDAVLLYSLSVGPLWQRVGAAPPAPVAMGDLR